MCVTRARYWTIPDIKVYTLYAWEEINAVLFFAIHYPLPSYVVQAVISLIPELIQEDYDKNVSRTFSVQTLYKF